VLLTKAINSLKVFILQKPKFIFALGLAFAVLASYLVEENIKLKQKDHFEHVVEKLTEDIQISLNQYYHVLEGNVGLLHAFKFNINSEIYHNYALARHNFDTFKGAIGIGYIKKVAQKDLEQYVTKIRQDNPDFNLKRLGDTTNPLRNSDYLFIIENVEPIAVNQKAVGLVVSDESHRLDAAVMAMKTGEPSLTKSIQLVQAEKQEPGFLFYVPVYSTFETPATEQERTEKLIGWAYSPILASKIFSFAAQQRAESIHFEVYEVANNAQDNNLIYTSHQSQKMNESALWTQNISMAGQNWLIKADITQYANMSYENYLSLGVLFIGFLISYLFYTAAQRYQIESDFKNAAIKSAQDDAKMAYAELKKGSDFLHKTINSVPAMIGYWDKDLKNRLSNNIYTKYFGKMPSEIYGQHIKDLLSEEVYLKNLAFIEKALAGEAQQFERVLTQPNGENRHVLAKYIPDIINHEVHGFFAVVIDITELKNLEKQNRESQAQLYSKAKLSTLGEMASGIAHEINNPLTIISIKSQKVNNQIKRLFIEETEKNSIHKSLTDIESTVERIAAIVKGLRNFSRDSEQDPYSNVQINKIVNEVTDLCRERIAKKNINLKINCPQDIELTCNSVQISQVIMNLVSNSIDAIENLNDKWVEISASKINTDTIQIEVVDSGLGIPADVEDKIMEPFFTTKDVGKGTGLGLSISKGIIEMHGGKLQYQLKNGHTCFKVTLPLKQQSVNPLAS